MTTDVMEPNNKPLTMEDLMTAVKGILVESSAKFAQDLTESSAKFAQDLKLMQEAWDKQNKELKKQIGGMGNNNGAFAQEFFFNAIFYGDRKLFGQEFDDAMTEVRKYFKKGGAKSEFDIILFNGKSICIVEVKYKADTDDARNLPEKEKSFRAVFPEHADKKLYLALASMSFDKHVENECKKQGLAMIKQVGDTIEIYDEHIKVF